MIHHTFDDGSFSQEQYVDPRERAVFHVFPEFGDELDANGLLELFK